jgi:hypothetical protein
MLRIVLVLAAALALGGCSFFDQVTSDWFGDGPPPTASPTASASQEEVFYSSIDGLPMHFLPSGSSQIVSRLTLHQRVTRTDLQRGYARVVADNGLEGWVDNAKLLWRLPATPVPIESPALVDTPPPAIDVATPVVAPVAPDAPVEPAAAATPVEPTPTAVAPGAEPSEIYAPRTPTPTPAVEPTKAGADPGIFDPF